MDLLSGSLLGNDARAWLVAAGVMALSFVVIRFVAVWLAKRLTALAGRTQVYWDDVVASSLEATKSVLILLVALFLGSNALVLPERSVRILQSVAVIALLVQGGLWLTAGLTTWLVARTKVELEEDPAQAMTLNLIGIGLRLLTWAMVVLLALDNVGIDVTALVAGLGIGGVAVALAAQNILGDLFGSLSIALDKPFVLGDFVIVGDFMGAVEAIGIKTTRLRSLSGEQLVFSNTDLLDSRIRNYGRMYERRVVLTLGVTYQTPREELARIPEVIRRAIEGEGGEDVRIDRSHLSAYGDSSIQFEAVYFVLSPEYALHMDIKQSVLLKIHEVFDERGVEFAYPTRTVFVEQSD